MSKFSHNEMADEIGEVFEWNWMPPYFTLRNAPAVDCVDVLVTGYRSRLD